MKPLSDQQYKLLIIDSGVGGLSILNEIRQALPSFHSVYIADNFFYPYGTKSEQEIIDRVVTLATQALNNDQFAALVLACNTASTIALPALRRTLDIPVIGVVPAIKPAAIKSTSKVIGLLATPGTVARQYTQDLINTFADHCTVIKVGSSTLVDMAENTLEQKHHSTEEYATVLADFWKQPYASTLDTIVLGCTHFPLLAEQLKAAAPDRDIQWIDSGAAVARQIKASLLNTQEFSTDCPQGSHTLLFTAAKDITPNLTASLRQLGISNINFLD